MIVHPQRHLNDLLKNFSSAMMITRSGDKSMHGRPMSIAEIGEGCSGDASQIPGSRLRLISRQPI